MNTWAHTSFAVISTTMANIVTYASISPDYNPATLWDSPPVAFTAMIAAAAYGSLLPDIENPKRFLGSKSIIIRRLIPYDPDKSRTIMHSVGHFLIVSAILVAITLYAKMNLSAAFAIYGLIYGYFTHLVLDLFSEEGIPVFWLKKNVVEDELSLLGSEHGSLKDVNKYISLPPRRNGFLKFIVWGALLYGSFYAFFELGKIVMPMVFV